jgi:hypothetical protein
MNKTKKKITMMNMTKITMRAKRRRKEKERRRIRIKAMNQLKHSKTKLKTI